MGRVEDRLTASPRDDAKQAEAPDRPDRGGVLRELGQRAVALDVHTVLAALGFLALFAVNFFAPTDPDFWWHIRTGQLITETGALPGQDVFSYTALGKPWHIPEWLSEILMYRLYASGGYGSLVATFSLVVTGTYFILYRLLLRLEVERTLALALVAWTAVVRLALWAPRPQLITFLFFAVTLYLLFVLKQHGRARLWLLPPLMVLWVNVHGAYVAGLLLIGLFAAGEALNRATGRPAAPLRPLFLAGVASVLATALNPYGLATLLAPLKYATTGNASTRYIAEWQVVDFHSYIFVPFALTLVLLMIVGSRGHLDFTHTLLVLAFSIMALQSERHVILFALATAPVLALRLKERNVRLIRDVGTARRPTPPLTLAPLLVMPVFVAYVVIASPYSQARPTPSAADYPAGAVAYLKEHHPAGNLFNTFGWGGYLIHELYPEYRVFIDGRSDFYGDALLEEYVDVARISPRWREVLQKYGVDTVLIERDAPLAVLLASQSDWQKIYEGPIEQIFVRHNEP